MTIGLLAALSLLATATVAAAAPPSPASAPVKIFGGEFRGLSEVVDSGNHVNVAATSSGGVWYITDRSGTWTKTKVLSNLPNRSYQEVSIALDTSDHVYIAGRRSSCDGCVPGGSDGIFLVTDKGRARGHFSAATTIAPAGSGEPSLKVFGGHVFVAFVKQCCQPGPMPPVFMRTNASGVWTQARVALHGDNPQLRIGSDGRARVAFTMPRAVGYATAGTTIGSFVAASVPGSARYDQVFGLALDASNRPNILWLRYTYSPSLAGDISPADTVNAYYAWKTAAGWHAAENVAELGTANNAASFDLDSLGRPNIAAGGTTVEHYVRVSGHWLSETVSNSSDVYLIALRRAFSGHVVIAYENFGGGLFVWKN